MADVSSVRFAIGIAKGDDGNTAVTGIDPATINSVLKLKWADGDANTLGALTDARSWSTTTGRRRMTSSVGDSMSFTTPLGREQTYEIAGTFRTRRV